MWGFLLLGISFGLQASVNPGPSLTLAIARSLRDGARAGMLVTIAPLVDRRDSGHVEGECGEGARVLGSK